MIRTCFPELRRAFIVLLTLSHSGAAQEFVISTVAGLYSPGSKPEAGINVSIGNVSGVATDSYGNVYFSSSVANPMGQAQDFVLKLDANGILTRAAGNPIAGYSGDGGPATSAQLNGANGVAVDRSGNLYISDSRNNRVRKVSQDGFITTIAGNGTSGYSGDGGPATVATLDAPSFLAMDSAGNLFIAVRGYRIRKLSPDGIINLVAGNGNQGYTGDGGPATEAAVGSIAGMAVDASGTLYFSDYYSLDECCIDGEDYTISGSHIRKVTAEGIIETVAGNGTDGYSGDAGQVAAAQVNHPGALTFDAPGNLYFYDAGNGRIRMVNPAGMITTVAGNGTNVLPVDGLPALSTGSPFAAGMATDMAGNLYIADNFQRIRKVSEGILITVAGLGGPIGGADVVGEGDAATLAPLFAPTGVALSINGFLYIADTYNNVVRLVQGDGRIRTVAGNGRSFNSTVAGTILHYPGGLTVDSAGNLYIADSGYNRVLMISLSGSVTNVAGSAPINISGFAGDGGPAENSKLNWPKDIAVDSSGNVYIADTGNNRIRMVTQAGIITTIAGGGNERDGAMAVQANLSLPTGVAIDSSGNLYIADTGHYTIRKVSMSGIISTVAGNGVSGYSGDGGPAGQAQLSNPLGVRLDGAGNLYIADGGSVRMMSPAGIITTVAGTGVPGFSGDGGPATRAQVGAWGLTVDGAGNLYVADPWDNTVRLLKK